MRQLALLGLPQGILPPHERPFVPGLRRLGFTGSDAEVIDKAHRTDPALLAACCSASSMWAANAATVAPSADAADGRVHFTPANLQSTLHRAFEPPQTSLALRRIFPGEGFVHHDPLPVSASLGDEGAANHTRFETPAGALHLFAYGRSAMRREPEPKRFPARQTREASQAVARLHRLSDDRAHFVRQSPDAIDEGVFHNDVVAVGNGRLLFYHEEAYADADAIDAIRSVLGPELVTYRVSSDELSLASAVQTYLFNSQIVTLPTGTMALIAPAECEESEAAKGVIDHLIADDRAPVTEVHYLDVRQSMRNGGGPACLRLRVPLEEDELSRVHAPCLLSDEQHARLERWVRAHYREELSPEDLADPQLLEETRKALDELTGLLELGSDFYPFQRSGA
jgi:succinylarginine dihydrolase